MICQYSASEGNTGSYIYGLKVASECSLIDSSDYFDTVKTLGPFTAYICCKIFDTAL